MGIRSSRRRLSGGIILAMVAALSVAVVPAQAAAPNSDGANLESVKPGTLLESHPVQIAAGSLIPLKVKAWQLRYRTTDPNGKATTAITTALLPADAKPDQNRPLVAYDSFEDSIPQHCAPSYALQQNLNWDSAPVQLELIFIAMAVRKGYAVTVPDHLGPKGMYTAGDMSGHATLDAIRATESFGAMGLNGSRTKTGLLGYSGGSQAAEFAASLQPKYAPELNLVGVAAGGLPPDLRPVYNKINKGPAVGISLTAIGGLTNAYPELRKYVQEHLTDQGKVVFDKVQKQCLQTTITQTIGMDANKLFTVKNPLDQPIPRKYLDKVQMRPDVKMRTPLYLYHAINDELLPIQHTDQLVNGLCEAGNDITYRRDFASEHLSLGATGMPDAFLWLSDRLDGKPAKSGCDRKDVFSTLATPKNFGFFGKVLIDTLLDVAGRPVGK